MSAERQDRGELRVDEVLDEALRALGVRRRVRESQLQDVFRDVIGPAVAPYARARSLRNGILTIAIAHTALSHQFTLDAPRLITALNERLGARAVARLHFVPLDQTAPG